MLIFLDLKKAFDWVDRSKLERKLGTIGVAYVAPPWRGLVVILPTGLSLFLFVIMGVILSRQITEWSNKIKNPKLNIFGELFLFTDDTLIIVPVKVTLPLRCSRRLCRPQVVKKWLDQNNISLNTSKTKFFPIAISKNIEYMLCLIS